MSVTDFDSSSSESEFPACPTQPISCSMERTKLSTKQIRHALPEWMFVELVDEAVPGERRQKKTRRGNRSKRSPSRDSGCESTSPPPSPLLPMQPTTSLSKSIASLPVDLQRCFSEWRRERKMAMMQNDLSKLQEVERVMWSAYHNITQANLVHSY